MTPSEREWTNLYDLYAEEVNRFLHSLLRNPNDVDDLRQETFFKALCYWDTHREKSSTKTWLFSIARNLAVDKLRREKRMEVLLKYLPLTDEKRTLEESVLKDEKSRLIHNAISTLPVFYRLVVTLRGIQEFTPSETAEILGCSVNKVNVNYHRALKKLRKLLEEEEFNHVLFSN